MIEKYFFLGAIALYAVGSVLFAARILSPRESVRRWAVATASAGLAVHAIGIAVRWSAAGHGPYVSTYEVLSSDAWVAVLFFLLLQWRFRSLSAVGAVVLPLAFVLMGIGLMGSDEIRELPPTLRSSWLVVHVLFAKLTVASMVSAAGLAALFLIKDRGVGSSSERLARLPSAAVLDDYSYRLVAFGFIALTLMIVTGAVWAQASWGSYWSWDPTETWSLVVWMVYGLYLHGRVTFRWKGRVSAYFVIGALLFSLIAFFVLPYFVKGQHSEYMTG